MEGRTPTRPWRSAVVLLLLPLLTLVSTAAGGSGPYETGPTGTTRVVRWTMDDSTSLVLENVSLASSEAVLSWRRADLGWTRGSDFLLNGTADANVSTQADGLVLRADLRNHLSNGSFDALGPWAFEDAPTGRTTATWDPARQDARIEHGSAASPSTQWDSMDSQASWFSVGSDGSSELSTSTVGQQEGTGMLEDRVSTGPSATAWVGAFRMGLFNWTSYDRLELWILAPSTPSTLVFNVTTLVGPILRGTVAKPLSPGWQQHEVDLTELGPDRGEISQVTLRFSAPFLDREVFYIDDVRLLNAKRANESGSAFQPVVKSSATSPARGTARISYAWVVANVSGVDGIETFLQVTGPPGSFERSAPAQAAGTWAHETIDSSAWLTEPGTYEIRVGIRFAIETTSASNATVRLDNVTFQIPGRGNGTFLSSAVDLGARSQLERLTWSADLPNGTSIALAARFGDTPTAGGPTWTDWAEFASPGDYPFILDSSARYLQVRAELGTLDGSLSPALSFVGLAAGHRALDGSVTTLPFTAEAGFLRWLAFEPGWNATAPTSVGFEVSDGSSWASIGPGEDLRDRPLGRTVQFRVALTTTDGLATPRLSWISATYEVQGGGVLGFLLANPFFLGLVGAGAVAYIAYAFVSRRMYGVEDLFLIHRDGRLILHTTNRLRPDRDEDLFAGMLTAISSFAKDAFREEAVGLRQFQVGDKKVLIERLESVYLAAIYAGRIAGRASRHLHRLAVDIDRSVGGRLRGWSGDPEDVRDARPLTDRFVRRGRYRRWPFARRGI